jgi:hypothetical protein
VTTGLFAPRRHGKARQQSHEDAMTNGDEVSD